MNFESTLNIIENLSKLTQDEYNVIRKDLNEEEISYIYLIIQVDIKDISNKIKCLEDSFLHDKIYDLFPIEINYLKEIND
ncbi:MAG: hypothetical protein WC136_00445 [Sphaerochaeta sp.]|jgi:hypothetical protein